MGLVAVFKFFVERIPVLKHAMQARARNKSVPQNICFSGKFLLAGGCGKNNLPLEGKCCWE